eukprot:9233888-Prorocentrum_lima.AAC.1
MQAGLLFSAGVKLGTQVLDWAGRHDYLALSSGPHDVETEWKLPVGPAAVKGSRIQLATYST